METTHLNQVGAIYRHSFSFIQAQVNDFMQVTGDNNPLHWDENYAAQTPFKKPIIHGFLGGSIFSKVLGTIFPAEGTVYLAQEMKFLRPMYVEVIYEAVFTIQEIDPKKHKATIKTEVFNQETKKVCISGAAEVVNEKKFF
jgi:acyl dehydratase